MRFQLRHFDTKSAQEFSPGSILPKSTGGFNKSRFAFVAGRHFLNRFPHPKWPPAAFRPESTFFKKLFPTWTTWHGFC